MRESCLTWSGGCVHLGSSPRSLEFFILRRLKQVDKVWTAKQNGGDFVESAVGYGDRPLRERDRRAAKMTGLHAWCKACALQVSEYVQSVFILIYEFLSFYCIGRCKTPTMITSPFKGLSRKAPLWVLVTGRFGILRKSSGFFERPCWCLRWRGSVF